MKIIKSFAFALNGLKICFTSETNFKVHSIAALLVITEGFVFRIAATEWILVICCIAFVVAMEMLNTAIEKLCDVVQENFHPGIKKVKDMAAGAVLVSACCSAVVGAIIFLPKIFYFFKLW